MKFSDYESFGPLCFATECPVHVFGGNKKLHCTVCWALLFVLPRPPFYKKNIFFWLSSFSIPFHSAFSTLCYEITEWYNECGISKKGNSSRACLNRVLVTCTVEPQHSENLFFDVKFAAK